MNYYKKLKEKKDYIVSFNNIEFLKTPQYDRKIKIEYYNSIQTEKYVNLEVYYEKYVCYKLRRILRVHIMKKTIEKIKNLPIDELTQELKSSGVDFLENDTNDKYSMDDILSTIKQGFWKFEGFKEYELCKNSDGLFYTKEVKTLNKK